MPTRADVDRITKVNQRIAEAARKDLAAFWSTLNLSDPASARNALLAFMPELTATYGQAAASAASIWYEELRADAGVRGAFSASPSEPVATEIVAARTRYGAGHLWSDAPEETLKFLYGITQQYALQPGRDTIMDSTHRDKHKPSWARVPQGAETCAFCLMLASRGAVYSSASSAGEMRQFHGDCDCAVTPIWTPDDLPEGYDPEALYNQYLDARDASRSHETPAILAELREQQGID